MEILASATSSNVFFLVWKHFWVSHTHGMLSNTANLVIVLSASDTICDRSDSVASHGRVPIFVIYALWSPMQKIKVCENIVLCVSVWEWAACSVCMCGANEGTNVTKRSVKSNIGIIFRNRTDEALNKKREWKCTQNLRQNQFFSTDFFLSILIFVEIWKFHCECRWRSFHLTITIDMNKEIRATNEDRPVRTEINLFYRHLNGIGSEKVWPNDFGSDQERYADVSRREIAFSTWSGFEWEINKMTNRIIWRTNIGTSSFETGCDCLNCPSQDEMPQSRYDQTITVRISAHFHFYIHTALIASHWKECMQWRTRSFAAQSVSVRSWYILTLSIRCILFYFVIVRFRDVGCRHTHLQRRKMCAPNLQQQTTNQHQQRLKLSTYGIAAQNGCVQYCASRLQYSTEIFLLSFSAFFWCKMLKGVFVFRFTSETFLFFHLAFVDACNVCFVFYFIIQLSFARYSCLGIRAQ